MCVKVIARQRSGVFFETRYITNQQEKNFACSICMHHALKGYVQTGAVIQENIWRGSGKRWRWENRGAEWSEGRDVPSPAD